MLLLDNGELVAIENKAIKVTADHKTLILVDGHTSPLTESDYELIREMFAASADEIRQRVEAARRQRAINETAMKAAMGKGLLVPMHAPPNGGRLR